MTKPKPITPDELHDLLAYDEEAGCFTWKKRRGFKANEGSQAGVFSKNGYVCIKVNYRSYKAHRLAWLYVHGRWPVGDIDHIDGDRSNNRIKNLREVSRRLNSQNRSFKSSNSISGYVGVTPERGRWVARIKKDWKLIRIGLFDTPEQAAEAYKKAKAVYHILGNDR